ncbi:hypothetical protein DEO72_LG9g2093 [Vigna unguiculata]|uniref:Uncharacterized protein n=1 Tax=Vigna unguiculata TaxID=3917 RepID=A0A4D6N502_VIGUN|nr:hypothetical protein DEO72_LG9g2093 [Vigna unguiculata]
MPQSPHLTPAVNVPSSTCLFCACNLPELFAHLDSTCTNVATIFSCEIAMLDAIHHTQPSHLHLQLCLVLSVCHVATIVAFTSKIAVTSSNARRTTNVAPRLLTTYNSQHRAPLRCPRVTIFFVQHFFWKPPLQHHSRGL